MKKLQIDYTFIFDQDNTLSLLNTERYDCMITEDLPDWWASPIEKEEARTVLVEIDKQIDSLHYIIGDRDGTDLS